MVTLDIEAKLIPPAQGRRRTPTLRFFADVNHDDRITFVGLGECTHLSLGPHGVWKASIAVASEKSMLYVFRWLDVEPGSVWDLVVTSSGKKVTTVAGVFEHAYGQCGGITPP